MTLRISKEKLASNMRMNDVEVAVVQAVSDAHMEDLTYLELLTVLQNVQTRWLENALNKECPSSEIV